MVESSELKVGTTILIKPGQYLGRERSKIAITAAICERYEWSWVGLTSLLVKCKPQSRPFMVNLRHGEVELQQLQSSFKNKGGRG